MHPDLLFAETHRLLLSCLSRSCLCISCYRMTVHALPYSIVQYNLILSSRRGYRHASGTNGTAPLFPLPFPYVHDHRNSPPHLHHKPLQTHSVAFCIKPSMANPNINLELTERDEAGNVVATYIQSSRVHEKEELERVDLIVSMSCLSCWLFLVNGPERVWKRTLRIAN